MANRQLIDDLGLNWSTSQRDEFLAEIKVVELPKLGSPYPPTDPSSIGTPEEWHPCQEYWADNSPTDPLYNEGFYEKTVDLDSLKYIVPQEESVIFRDIETKETVLVVLRDFIPDGDLRQIMMRVCREIIKSHQDDNHEDPEMFHHIGYTCGTQNDAQVRLAASCIKLNTDEEINEETELNDAAQGVAGIVWNLMKSRFPPEVTANYNDTIHDIGFPPMEMLKDGETFTFKVGGEDITFDTGEDGLELPPLSGMAARYYAQHTHTEVNDNSWIVACTVKAPDDTTTGGNFYLASYGIMVLPTTNTACARRSCDYKDTSLYEKEPSPEDCAVFEVHKDRGLNRDMVFEILKSLKAARKRSNWLDDCRKWKVTKATSPKVRSRKANSAKSSLLATETELAAPRYKLRPRTTKPNYCVDSESSTDSEACDSGSGSEFEDESSEFEVEPTNQMMPNYGVDSELFADSEASDPGSEFEAEPTNQTTTIRLIDDTDCDNYIEVNILPPPDGSSQLAWN
ncbi:hypothetical protein F4813DRAFT_398989 [Daldinia decipiens]|uniref:uncharacterized protein n=1 Tax=Daldinia decipiens TaxID=326647 RepID=UPI0020C4E53A|nr:uncharacterized protein F4813DRAFT_398989 [Daldinia decipiens]KAI1654473.1 hypothetical protein F4813DRAFT_398989 [Daldinia decipiens]